MCIWRRRRLALRILLTPDTCSRERPKEKKSQEKIDPSRVSYMITCCLKSSSVVENSERLVVQIEFQGKNKDNVMATSVHPDKFRGESLELEREQELSDEDKLKVKTELFLGEEKPTHNLFLCIDFCGGKSVKWCYIQRPFWAQASIELRLAFEWWTESQVCRRLLSYGGFTNSILMV